MVKTILGSSPRTTIAGLVLAGLVAYNEVSAHETDIKKIMIPVAIVVLSRLVKDSDGINRKEEKEDVVNGLTK